MGTEGGAAMAKLIIEVTMDCADAVRLSEFWSAALFYEVLGAEPGAAYLRDPDGTGPFLCLLEVPEAKAGKNRMHFDLNVTGEGDADVMWQRVQAEAARLVALGATVRAEHPPTFVGMADPEGNEFDVTYPT
jgi:hypothetical protein